MEIRAMRIPSPHSTVQNPEFRYDKTLVTEVKGSRSGLVGIYELKDHL